MARAYIGLGANLGDREATLRRALELLARRAGIDVVAVSSLRETDPVGLADQPRFLNAAAALETDARAARAARAAARGRARARPDARRARASGPRDDRPRPAALRRRARRRAGARGPAPAAARAALRARAARRARSGPRRPRSRPGGGTARGARLIAMSHLDELDEFEAELELRLKKEYTAVFGALPLLRADAGRDVPLQQARPPVRAAAELPVLPPARWRTSGCGTRTARRGSSRAPRSTPRATSRSRSCAARATSRS